MNKTHFLLLFAALTLLATADLVLEQEDPRAPWGQEMKVAEEKVPAKMQERSGQKGQKRMTPSSIVPEDESSTMDKDAQKEYTARKSEASRKESGVSASLVKTFDEFASQEKLVHALDAKSEMSRKESGVSDSQEKAVDSVLKAKRGASASQVKTFDQIDAFAKIASQEKPKPSESMKAMLQVKLRQKEKAVDALDAKALVNANEMRKDKIAVAEAQTMKKILSDPSPSGQTMKKILSDPSPSVQHEPSESKKVPSHTSLTHVEADIGHEDQKLRVLKQVSEKQAKELAALKSRQ